MSRKTVEEHLAAAPLPVRRAMIAGKDSLEPGAAAVVGRLFAIAARRQEPLEVPSATSFREAAGSEPTFRTLLRTLAAFAPGISSASALEVKAEWVARRKPVYLHRHPARPQKDIDILTWPQSWQALWPGLKRAKIAQSSLNRYRASINRCAQLVAEGKATEELGFLTAYNLAEALPDTCRKKTRTGRLRPWTVANYIEGLVVLARYGQADEAAISGLRFVRDHLRQVADAGDKLKFERVRALMERGGFAYAASEIGRLRALGASLPHHTAEKIRALRAAALCSVLINKPSRTGDVSGWRFGHEICRGSDGSWTLGWRQQKNGLETDAGTLWPEVGEVLDELVLGGRPERFIHLRYREVVGLNWMSFTERPRSSHWPSEVVKAVLKVPSHDLRTLAADYLRLHDPETAAGVIATHLGHASMRAGGEYRALAEGDAASRSWSRMRNKIGKE
ncbi:hypothetical protein PVT71_00240 [Salipiger sp. H15]|uniref:Integrase n=1 Tax=Alloyangia sp. H15 TaxID=3029062 RepID=A0AAU8AGR5_9RHOB